VTDLNNSALTQRKTRAARRLVRSDSGGRTHAIVAVSVRVTMDYSVRPSKPSRPQHRLRPQANASSRQCPARAIKKWTMSRRGRVPTLPRRPNAGGGWTLEEYLTPRLTAQPTKMKRHEAFWGDCRQGYQDHGRTSPSAGRHFRRNGSDRHADRHEWLVLESRGPVPNVRRRLCRRSQASLQARSRLGRPQDKPASGSAVRASGRHARQ
jgi:hypothetical protein